MTIIRENPLRDDISKILVKWSMPTRQIAITEIQNLLNAQIPKIEEYLLQSLVVEVEGLRTYTYKRDLILREKVIALITKRMGE